MDKYSDLIERHNEYQNKKSADVNRIFLIVLFVLLGLTLFLLLFLLPSITPGTKIAFYIIGGILYFVLLLVYIFVSMGTNEKALFDLTLPKILSLEFTGSFEYASYPKKQNYINQKGGLFTRFATADVRFKMSGMAGDTLFTLLRKRLFTSDGRNQYTHFDGIYIVYQYDLNKVFQVRTDGKPHLKKTKFERLDEKDIKVYTLDNAFVDSRYIDTAQELHREFKKVYISSVTGEVHVALSGKKYFNRLKTLNSTNIRNVIADTKELIDYSKNIISQLTSF